MSFISLFVRKQVYMDNVEVTGMAIIMREKRENIAHNYRHIKTLNYMGTWRKVIPYIKIVLMIELILKKH